MFNRSASSHRAPTALWLGLLAALTLLGARPACADFSLSINPVSVTVSPGGSVSATVSTNPLDATAATISLTSSLHPGSLTTALNPTSVAPGGSSTLTISVFPSAATGTYFLTVTGTQGAVAHSTAVTVTVTSSAVVTRTVTTSADSGPGSLRQVVQDAGAGDTIVFAPEVSYIALSSGQISFAKPLTIDGPGVILDGLGAGRIFAISASANAQTVKLSGLTIQNGYADVGGGISVYSGASVALVQCLLTGNYAGYSGGALNAYSSTVTLTGCTLTGNSASYIGVAAPTGGGGALAAFYSPITLTGCTLTGNSTGEGGALLAQRGPVTMTGCTFSGNSARIYGGALFAQRGPVTLTTCTFSDNSARSGGGGLCVVQCPVTLIGCTLSGNSSGYNGAGLSSFYSPVTLSGCTLTGNSARYAGGALSAWYIPVGGRLSVIGCTLTGNSAGYYGGGLVAYSSTVTLNSSIVYGNGGGNGNETESVGDGGIFASYCDLKQYNGVTDNGHNISADPRFVTPYTDSITVYDLRLKASSPCARAGDPALAGTLDITGTPRAAHPTIGAYEAEADTTPPVTSVVLSGPLGTHGWFRGAVQVNLSASDPEGDDTVAATYYTIDGGDPQTYASLPITIAGEGRHFLTFWSVDKAGNEEHPHKFLPIKIDSVAPALSASASTTSLWPPNGKMIPVSISGSVADALSGVDPGSLTYSTVDSVGKVQPSGSISLSANGSYSFTIQLDARRKGADASGRTYTVTVNAKDYAGNAVSKTIIITAPHDQGN